MERIRAASILVAALLAGCAGAAGEESRQDARHTVHVAGAAREARDDVAVHRVLEGETLAGIAEAYGTTAATLQALNGIDDPRTLAAGELLTVAPAPPPVLPCDDPLVPVNKQHALAPDCTPAELEAVPARYAHNGPQSLTPEALDAFVAMMDAAAAEGHALVTRSTYRSYETQAATFAHWVEVLGLEEAERTSARAGHSEHQLGTTADVTSASVGFELVEEFGETPEGRWVAANAWRFGFVISYPEGRQTMTGYAYEPWHLRYVGRAVAREVEESGLTPHEFLMRRWVLGTGAP